MEMAVSDYVLKKNVINSGLEVLEIQMHLGIDLIKQLKLVRKYLKPIWVIRRHLDINHLSKHLKICLKLKKVFQNRKLFVHIVC